MNLRVREVAVRLNISEKTVYKWLRDGLLPARRIGKTWIISEEAVQAAIEPRASSPTRNTVAAPRLQSTVSLNSLSIDQTLDSARTSDAETLGRFTGILSGAVAQGVEAILGPRGSDQGTTDAIGRSLESAHGEVLLQGIGLREFFGDRGHTAILRQLLVEDRAVQIRAILVNPVSEYARARALAQDGFQFEDEGRFKGGPLYSDSWRSLNVIAAMKTETETRSHFGLEVRFVDHWPSVYLVATDESTYVETYQFGRPDEAVEGSSFDGLVPMLKYSSQSSYAQLLRKHFNYVWSGVNPYIKTHSLSDIADAMQVKV